MATDREALLLQISADVRGLQKQFAKAGKIVDDGSAVMERRAKKAMQNIEASNDNFGKKLARGFGANIGEGIRDLAGQSGQLSTVLGEIGPAGVVAAAGVGALLAVLAQAKSAIAFGDAIADSAAKVGVSTDTLQEYRYAIHQLGGDYDDADEGLSKFTEALGKAQLQYSKKSIKPFAMLGFTKADLDNFHSADEALQAILDRLAGIQDESKRQALASTLGLEKFIPVAREGAGKLNELRAAAHRLGFVMDADIIAKTGEANDTLEDLAKVTAVQLNSAFADLTPVILEVAQAIADAAREVNHIARDIKDAMPVLQKWFGLLASGKDAGSLGPFGDLASGAAGGVRAALSAAARAGRVKTQQAGIADILAGKKGDAPSDFNEVYGPAKPKPFSPLLGGGSATSPRDTTAERTEQVKALLAQASKDLIQAQSNLTDDIDAHAQMERDITAQELAADLAKLNKQKADLDDEKGIGDETRKALKAKIDDAKVLAQQAADAKVDLINRQANWAAEDRADDTRKAIRDAEIDRLQFLADTSRSEAERTFIEERILKIRQAELAHLDGKAISRQVETGTITPEEGELRGAQGADQRATERDQFALDHEGPLKKYLRGIQDLNTEMQDAGVEAIESLSSGLADAIVNAKSLGDVGASVFKQLEAQILQMLIKTAVSKGADIFNFLGQTGATTGFSGGGYTGHGGVNDIAGAVHRGEVVFDQPAVSRLGVPFLEALRKGKIPGYAKGGLVGFPMPTFPTVESLTAGRSSSEGSQPYFDLRGAVVTEELMARMNKEIAASEQRATIRGARGGAALAQSNAAKAARTRLGRP